MIQELAHVMTKEQIDTTLFLEGNQFAVEDVNQGLVVFTVKYTFPVIGENKLLLYTDLPHGRSYCTFELTVEDIQKWFFKIVKEETL